MAYPQILLGKGVRSQNQRTESGEQGTGNREQGTEPSTRLALRMLRLSCAERGKFSARRAKKISRGVKAGLFGREISEFGRAWRATASFGGGSWCLTRRSDGEKCRVVRLDGEALRLWVGLLLDVVIFELVTIGYLLWAIIPS